MVPTYLPYFQNKFDDRSKGEGNAQQRRVTNFGTAVVDTCLREGEYDNDLTHVPRTECAPVFKCMNLPKELYKGFEELKKCDRCEDYLCESVTPRDCCGILRCNECTSILNANAPSWVGSLSHCPLRGHHHYNRE